jgi:DNA-binding response OmpR family regulator
VVEDEEDVRTFVTTILRERGFHVLTAAHADAALQQLRQDTSVALLLTDVGLPGGKNGKKLADEAHELNRSMKVLFMTGYAKNAIIHHGRLDPGVHLLVKPFTERDLNRKLEEVLRSSPSSPRQSVVRRYTMSCRSLSPVGLIPFPNQSDFVM